MVWGPWQDEVERVFGVRRTSGDRSNAEQERYYQRGITSARGGQSEHNRPDNAIDIPPIMSAEAAERRAAAEGLTVDFTYESGRGRNQGSGPHLHGVNRAPTSRSRSTQASSGGTQVATRTPSTRNPSIRDTSADELLGSILGPDGEEIATNQGRHPLVNPFEIEGEARQRVNRVESALEASEKFLGHFDEVTAEVQGTRRARVEESVATRRGINDTVQAETQSMIERVQPLLAQRAQTAAQLERLASMNPLERGLRGVFDLNYNQGYLTRRLGEFDEVLQSVGQDYQYLTTLRERLMNTVTTGDANEALLESLSFSELDEEGRSVNMGLQNASQSFAALGDQVTANENLVRAQVAATDRFLSEQTTGSLTQLEQQATQAPGQRITVDGVELSVGEITDRLQAQQSQDMALEHQQMAITQGRQQAVVQAAELWARNATRAQLEGAINNGGVAANGMRIPQDVLTAQLADRMQRADLIAGSSQATDPTRAALANMTAIGREMQVVGGRARSMFGTSPPEFDNLARTMQTELTGIATRIREANAAGRPEVAAALSERINLLRTQFATQIGQVALRHAGGNQQVAGWIRSFLTGAEIDPGQAADALAYYAQRGAMPQGMRTSPQAQAAFRAAREAVQRVDAQIARRGGQAPSGPERQRLYREAIQAATPDAYNGESFNILMNDIPGYARRLRDPFAAVSNTDFQAARSASNSIPIQEIARNLGVSESDARLLFSGDSSSYRGANREALLTRIRDENLTGHLVARQQQVFAEHLDMSPSATENFRPSRALAEMLQRPELARTASNMELIGRGTSYGDFLVSGMTHGSLSGRFDQWAQSFDQQVTATTVAETASSRTRYQLWRNNPDLYSSVVLAAVPGLNQADEARLMAYIRQHPDSQPTMRGAIATLPGMGGVGRAREQARSMIMNQRFQDPELERVRRIAAEAWDETAASMDRAMETYYGSQSGSATSNY